MYSHLGMPRIIDVIQEALNNGEVQPNRDRGPIPKLISGSIELVFT